MTSVLAGMSAAQARRIGELAEGALRKGESLDEVWGHIEACLVTLAEREHSDHLDLNEKGLTQRLVTELGRRPGYRSYFFQKEDMEDEQSGKSPQVDIAVQAQDGAWFEVHGVRYAGGQRFLVLEAKRLPTPGTGREKEYLVDGKKSGNKKSGGGVERFKLGIHGADLRTVGPWGSAR